MNEPNLRKNPVFIQDELDESEKVWAKRYTSLKEQGYLLRPRYRPGYAGYHQPPEDADKPEESIRSTVSTFESPLTKTLSTRKVRARSGCYAFKRRSSRILEISLKNVQRSLYWKTFVKQTSDKRYPESFGIPSRVIGGRARPVAINYGDATLKRCQVSRTSVSPRMHGYGSSVS